MSRLSLRDFCIFCIIIFGWIFCVPIICMICFSFSALLLFIFPMSYIACREAVRTPRIHKNSLLRTALSSIPWHQWFRTDCLNYKYSKNTSLFVHPHGLMCLGTLSLIHFVPGSNTILAVSPFLFYIPFFGWLLPWAGVVPATKRGIVLVMQSDSNLLILPGGVPEIICGERGVQTFFLRQRMGIFKLAFAHKQTVLPIVIKNEEKMYNLISLPCKIQRLFLSWSCNIPLCFPWFGGIWGSFIPHRVHLEVKVAEAVRGSAASSFLPFKNLYMRSLTTMAPLAKIL